MFDVFIENEVAISKDWVVLVKTAVSTALQHEQITPPAELSLLLTDDAQIQQLNREFRQEDKPTDVLSFPVGEPMPGMGEGPLYLGDIAISVPYAARQAASNNHAHEAELCLLAVHGVLHLLGYDHADPEEKQAMWGVQTAVLQQLGFENINISEA